MRRANKEIKDMKVLTALLEQCPVGRLGTLGKDGYPMIKPLNFAYSNGRIYFHTALEGEKIDDIKRDNRVCFETDLAIAFLRAKNQPCEAEYLYQSIIIRGRAFLVVSDEEKVLALSLLMDKYQPDSNLRDFPEEKLKITGVVRIDIEEISGKEDLGKGSLREAVLQVLEEKTPLPFVLDKEA